MGYAHYDTPRGPAGYDVEDVCHQPGCTEEIDRGVGYLCGDQPGEDGSYGCGWWFCAEHCCEDIESDATPGSRHNRA